jgi:hypothetical protein
MTPQNQKLSPYAATLADLRAKRAKIDSAIQILEELSGLTPSVVGDDLQWTPKAPEGGIEETAGMFLGMSIVDASKKLLGLRKRTMGNVEIARELQAGGLVLTSAEPANVVGSVLTRRFNQVGDVVKVGRGIWGLKEWYPGRNFKQIGKAITISAPADDDSADVGGAGPPDVGGAGSVDMD